MENDNSRWHFGKRELSIEKKKRSAPITFYSRTTKRLPKLNFYLSRPTRRGDALDARTYNDYLENLYRRRDMVQELSGTLGPPDPEGIEDFDGGGGSINFSRSTRALYKDFMDKLGKWAIGSEVSLSKNKN